MAHVQTGNAADPTGSIAFSEATVGNTTTGNFLVAVGIWYKGGSDFSSITDDGGHTWLQAGTEQEAGSLNSMRVYYAQNITGRAAHKVRLTCFGSNSYPAIIASEHSGVALTGSLDQVAQTNGSSTTPASGATAARTDASELMIGAQVNEFSTDATIVAGTNVAWAIPTNGKITNGAATATGAIEHFYPVAGGTQEAQFTNGQNAQWGCLVATFKLAGGGGDTLMGQVCMISRDDRPNLRRTVLGWRRRCSGLLARDNRLFVPPRRLLRAA